MICRSFKYPKNLSAVLLLLLISATGLCGQTNLPLDLLPPPFDDDAAQSSSPPPASPGEEELEDIRDIHGPVSIPNPWMPLLIAAGVLAGLGLLGFLVRLIVRKLRQKSEPIPISPYEQALQELDATRSLMKSGQDKAFSIAVSDAVRYFLERQFDMPAPESTTEEFLNDIHDHPLIKGPLADNFSRFLQMCDLAKFARYPLGLAGMEELLGMGRKLVEETYVKHKMRLRLLAEAEKRGASRVEPKPAEAEKEAVMAK